ncbi:MAG: glycosyltransferase [Candidatus Omnitrophica bacterium]|nr:glycosyltransferase [Candidatus Omnitrophota bacterium]
MTVSIIIAVKTWQKNLEECVAKCLELDYPDFEIIILPDVDIRTLAAVDRILGIHGVKVIPTGPVSPAQKRDMALGHAKGDILAFIDDDAFPQKDWLKKAMSNFNDTSVAAVGGPAVTADNDTLKQKASGLVYSSALVSARYVYRYLPGKKRDVDDYPSCNFLIRKSIMQALGGFNTDFWPGEDTKLCLEITKKLGKKIAYDPEVKVFHHRRPLFLPHLKQIASYALHRGYFVKRYPQTSMRLPYFIPTLFLLSIIMGAALSIFMIPFRMAYFLALVSYILLVLIFSISKELRFIPYVFCGIILTHVTYGFYFIKGLLAKELAEDKSI